MAERLARGGPPSRANELRDLERELAAIERRRAELAALRERAVARIEALGPLALLRSEGRLERRMLRADLNDFARQAERLDEREGPLRDSRAQARAARRPTRRGETGRRGRSRSESPPSTPSCRDEPMSAPGSPSASARPIWRPPSAAGPIRSALAPAGATALRQLEGHRLRHGIGDPERPLGAEPADPAGRAEHRRALARLREARAQIERAEPGYRSPLRSREPEREHGREYGPRAPGLGHDDPGPRRRHGPSFGLGR